MNRGTHWRLLKKILATQWNGRVADMPLNRKAMSSCTLRDVSTHRNPTLNFLPLNLHIIISASIPFNFFLFSLTMHTYNFPLWLFQQLKKNLHATSETNGFIHCCAPMKKTVTDIRVQAQLNTIISLGEIWRHGYYAELMMHGSCVMIIWYVVYILT